MNSIPVSIKEQDKLKTQDESSNPDAWPDVNLDDISRIASEICHTPAALVCIVNADHKWLRTFDVIDNFEIPEDFPFCNQDEIFIIPDLSKDKKYKNNSFVKDTPNAVFYAGVRLVDSEGRSLGALCILDTRPGSLDDNQIMALKALARQVAALLELNSKVGQLKQKQDDLKMAYADLAKIAHIASHDLKSPLK